MNDGNEMINVHCTLSVISNCSYTDIFIYTTGMQSRTDDPFTEDIYITVEQMFEAGDVPIHTGMAYNALSLPARDRHLFTFMQEQMYVFCLCYILTLLTHRILTARGSMMAMKHGMQLGAF